MGFVEADSHSGLPCVFLHVLSCSYVCHILALTSGLGWFSHDISTSVVFSPGCGDPACPEGTHSLVRFTPRTHPVVCRTGLFTSAVGKATGVASGRLYGLRTRTSQFCDLCACIVLSTRLHTTLLS